MITMILLRQNGLTLIATKKNNFSILTWYSWIRAS